MAYPRSQNGTSPDSKHVDAKSTSIIIRPYRPEDSHDIQRLFLEGLQQGAGSLHATVNARYSLYFRRTYFGFATGIAGLSIAIIEASRNAISTIGVNPRWLLWGSSVLSLGSLLATGVLAYSWRKLFLLVAERTQEIVEKDLADIVSIYKLREVEGGEGYEPTGPCGFWVALDGDQVIGEIGLKSPCKGDETVGEVCRLNVDPRYRQRGVGKILMETVIAHARTSGLKALWLSTSEFHTAAVRMYQKSGWKLELTKNVWFVGIPSKVVNFRMELE